MCRGGEERETRHDRCLLFPSSSVMECHERALLYNMGVARSLSCCFFIPFLASHLAITLVFMTAKAFQLVC